ncbi:MAG: hypothetical protein LBH05_08425 [Deferribacteraceae bacterium]|jgi:nucleoside 2-deoxyribosyltransferase|nr:hypothetical protein [Deferribacteraceae bacterium]
MKVYLASAKTNKEFMPAVEYYLKSKISYIEFTSIWYNAKPVQNNKERYETTILQGVDKADLVIAIYPYGQSGTLCEMTYAVGKGIPVIYVRSKEFEEEDPLIAGGFTNITDIVEFNNNKWIATSLNVAINCIITISNMITK